MLWIYAALFWLAPLYVWRFQLVGLPTNFFMLACGAVLLAGFARIIISNEIRKYTSALTSLPKWIKWSVIFFFVASIVSLLVGGIDTGKLGQWLVLYFLPIALASQIYFYISKQEDNRKIFLWSLYGLMGILGAVALMQYFFLLGLPTDFWGNSQEPKRSIGLFAHPNGFALFTAPLLVYLVPNLKERFEKLFVKFELNNFMPVLAWLLGAAGLFLSLSRGGWLGLAVALTAFVIMSSSRKLLVGYALAAIIAASVIFIIPNLRYRVLLPFMGEKSSVARLSLWDTAGKMIGDSPILGKGINGFSYNWDKYNTDPGLEHYNFPHNFILNAWVDLGFLGLLSWLSVVAYSLWLGWKNKTNIYMLGLGLFMLAMLAHGLIDIPYFKNDLAFVFWTVVAISAGSRKV